MELALSDRILFVVVVGSVEDGRISMDRKNQFCYGMRLRGFYPGCQPRSGLVERRDDPSGRYYDILVYDRQLSDRELSDYELDRID